MKKFLLALLILNTLVYADKEDEERKRRRERGGGGGGDRPRVERNVERNVQRNVERNVQRNVQPRNIERRRDFQKGQDRTPTFRRPDRQQPPKVQIKDQIQKL